MSWTVRKVFAAPLVLTLTLALGGLMVVHRATPSEAGVAAAETVTVDIREFAFSPNSLTVPVGTRVTWVNRGNASHTTTSKGNLWTSPLLSNQQSFSFTFLKPGQYAYYCSPHPFMQGTITVQATQPAPPLLAYPPDGARLGTLGDTLRWEQPEGTSQFHIQVFPADSPQTGQPDGPALDLIIGDPLLVGAASFSLSEPVFGQGPYLLLPDITYRWRVRVANASNSLGVDDPLWSDWPAQRTFRTRAASSSTLAPVAPPPGGTDGMLPTVAWNDTDAAIFYYEVQLSADPEFRVGSDATAAVFWNLVHGGQSIPRRSWTVPRGAELAPGQYFWRVRPRVQGDGTTVAWSPSWSFTAAP